MSVVAKPNVSKKSRRRLDGQHRRFEAEGPEKPREWSRTFWGEEHSPVLQHSVLLVPRQGREDFDHVTIAPAAQVRMATTMSSRLELARPQKDAARTLRDLGFQDLRELRPNNRHVSPASVYSSLDYLGVTTALSSDEGQMAAARDKLSDVYEFVDDFRLSMPCRVDLTEAPPNRSHTSLAQHEWPELSGVGAAHAAGVRGAGVLVGVLDTGVDADHQEFEGQRINYRYVSLRPNSPYWPPRDCRGFDTDGHGTHVCGILSGKTVGVVPESQLYVASVIESETIFTSMSRVASGLNWLFRQFTRPDNEHLPAVLSMSLGFPAELPDVPENLYQQRLNTLQIFLRTLLQANVLPVVAIGNNGPSTMGYPGAFPEVLGVGAVDFAGNVAPFSGGGTIAGGRTKPDLAGYGVGVKSALERDYDGRSVFRRMNGTSMATPYVAGIATLYRSLHPAESVDTIKEMMQDAAQPLPHPTNRVGKGLACFRQSSQGRSSRNATTKPRTKSKARLSAARKPRRTS
jgi:subtilisin family serine protease